MQQADCAIVGGTATERVAALVNVTRQGFACFTEYADRSPAKAFKRACKENRWGKGGVYDLNKVDDRKWMARDDLAVVGV